ncbi:MAG: MarR family transcriptional regulator [Bacilli bacterium]|nr:MarR family transcriptional regulator [Bacilli bacterium]
MYEIKEEKLLGAEIKAVHNLLKREIKSLPVYRNNEHITKMQKMIIIYLGERQEKDIFQRDLEEVFSIRRSTATGILKLMEKNELIRRECVSYDARLKKIVLTERSLDIKKEITEEIKLHDKKLSKDISKKDLEVFFKVMNQIRKNLGE